MNRRFAIGLGLLCSLVLATVTVVMAADKEEETTIKQVMKVCMKGGLCKKVGKGEADDEEKKKLLKMFLALAENEPPKGDADSWEDKTNALIKAAAMAVVGKEGAGAALGKAANCGACHKAHKS